MREIGKICNFRRILTALAVILLLSLGAPRARAQDEIYEKSGAEELYQVLDEDAKDLLSRAGVEGGMVEQGVSGKGLLEGAGELLRDKLGAPFKALAALIGILVLCRLGSCFEDGALGENVQLLGAAACGAVMAGPVLGMLNACRTAADSASAFMAAAVPVYAGLLAAAGNLASGSGYSFLAMFAGGAIPVLASGILLPAMRIYLGLAAASSLSCAKVEKAAGAVYSLGKWVLVTAVTAFTGVLSVQTAVNAQVDAAAGKAAKLALTTGVPIVGGALGDAVTAIQNSVHIVKSGVGAFGILAALCLFAPAMIQCALWCGVCMAGQAAGDILGVPKASSLLGAFSGAVKMVLAVMASICAVCVASAAAIVFAGSS